MTCTEQLALHIPWNIFIQKLLLRPWHSYFHYYYYYFTRRKTRNHGADRGAFRHIDQSSPRGGGGEVTSGSVSSKIVSIYRFQAISRVWVKQISRFTGFVLVWFQFRALLFFHLMLQLFGHQIYCGYQQLCPLKIWSVNKRFTRAKNGQCSRVSNFFRHGNIFIVYKNTLNDSF